MRKVLTISVSEDDAALIREQARNWLSVSHYLRKLVHRDANRLIARPAPRSANDCVQPRMPSAWRCNQHVNIPKGPPVSVTLTDAAIGEWL